MSNAMHQDVDLPPAEWPGLEAESASYSEDPVTVGPFANVEEKPRPVGLLLALSLALVGVAAAVVSIKGC